MFEYYEDNIWKCLKIMRLIFENIIVLQGLCLKMFENYEYYVWICLNIMRIMFESWQRTACLQSCSVHLISPACAPSCMRPLSFFFTFHFFISLFYFFPPHVPSHPCLLSSCIHFLTPINQDHKGLFCNYCICIHPLYLLEPFLIWMNCHSPS